MRPYKNRIWADGWSNPASRKLYVNGWPTEPMCKEQHYLGRQCGGCSFYAEFNADYGLCCFRKSRHYLETVFEHFTCPKYVHEGWGPHTFSEDTDHHCWCRGGPLPP